MQYILLLFISLLFAEHINDNEALQVANNVYKEFNTIKSNDLLIDYIQKIEDDNQILLYVYHLNPAGFIIVSGNKHGHPYLGYSFDNNFNINDMPSNLNWFINNYKNNLKSAISNNYSREIDNVLQWNKYLDNSIIEDDPIRNVNPLIEAEFDQSGSWNNTLTAETGFNGPVGCVAVAMGQVMYYWKHPVQGVGYSQYYEPDFGPISVNFEEHTYNFDNMLDNQATEDSQLLLYHAGVSVNMDYNYSGSGASVCWEDPSSQYALDYHFSFKDNINCEPKLNYDDEGWSNLLKEQLDNGWPIIYRGYAENDGPGHAWNIDGYQDEYLHCNWGWGGSANGYFYFNNLNGQGFSFVESQAALINIFPEGIAFPVALFDYQIEDFTVYFNDISSEINQNEIINWTWDFGDGFYSNDVSPVHTFQDHDVYSVSLIISDNYGQDSDPHIEMINLLIGDINLDLSVNVVDVIVLVDLIINTPNTYNIDADLNQDGLLSILDIIALINIILA